MMDKIPRMSEIHDRIAERLKVTGKSMRKASMDGGLSPEAISKLLKNPAQSQTLETIDKLAIGLETTGAWLAYGVAPDSAGNLMQTPSKRQMLISVDLLREVLLYVLREEGVAEQRSAVIADIVPEALSGPPVDAVAGDPFLSFRIHLQLGDGKSERPERL